MILPLPPGPAGVQDDIRDVNDAVQVIRRQLECHLDGATPAACPVPPADDAPASRGEGVFAWLSAAFSLSAFETSVLAFAVAAEISTDVARLCAAGDDPALPYATPAVALRVFAGADTRAFAPAAALRLNRLVTLDHPGPDGLLRARLRIPEAVLYFLAGQPTLDDHLGTMLEIIEPGPLLPSEQALAQRLALVLAGSGMPVAQIAATPSRRSLGIAAAAARMLKATLFHAPQEQLPAGPAIAQTARLWQRDQFLMRGLLAVSTDGPDAVAAARLASQVAGPVIVISEASAEIERHCRRAVVRFHIGDPTESEIATGWRGLFGLSPHRAAPRVDELAARFRLPLSSVADCIAVAAEAAAAQGMQPGPDAILPHLAPLLREQAWHQLGDLAERLQPSAGAGDLILPDRVQATIDRVIEHYRNRIRVFDGWGFDRHGRRGLGVLFAGPSGTGKTMAAEFIARTLQLDLFRIDLSQVFNKYIGETEKNLGRIFDAASTFDAVLLFDEADVLFGRRSEVRDHHDRHANLQIGYLLQRMESYRGIAVLTSNLPAAMDPAFSRRLAYVVQFGFPDRNQRGEIWRRAIPPEAPTAALDFDRLSRLPLSGGQIRTVSLNAAVIAAGREQPLSMDDVMSAARIELAKQQRQLLPGELAG